MRYGLRPGFLVVFAILYFKVLDVVKWSVALAGELGDHIHSIVNGVNDTIFIPVTKLIECACLEPKLHAGFEFSSAHL